MSEPKSRWTWLKWLILFVFSAGLLTAGEGLEGDMEKAVIKYYDLEDSDVEVELRTSRIAIEPESYDSLVVDPLTRGEPRGLLSFAVRAYKKGEFVAEDQIRVKIEYFKEVYVTTDRIGRRDKITPEKVTLKRMEITSLTEKPVTSDDDLSKMWTLRSINKDQILTTGIVDLIPPVKSGQGVSILYKSGPLEIVARGIAMEDGFQGDMIRVRNNQSRKTILATVADDETVEISH